MVATDWVSAPLSAAATASRRRAGSPIVRIHFIATAGSCFAWNRIEEGAGVGELEEDAVPQVGLHRLGEPLRDCGGVPPEPVLQEERNLPGDVAAAGLRQAPGRRNDQGPGRFSFACILAAHSAKVFRLVSSPGRRSSQARASSGA